MKRFYTQTSANACAGGWQVLLDTRAVKTPAKATLVLPTKALAQALASEWAAQGEVVVPDTMPLTQYACSAIDRVAPSRGLVIGQVAPFVETDLMAYPAVEPRDLRAKQDAVWLPILAELKSRGWTVRQTDGLLAIEQDPQLKARASAWLESKDDFALTSLASLIEASGSFLLTYAWATDLIDLEAMIVACTLEERFSFERWGMDEEAEELLTRREADLRSAAQMLNLLS